MEFGQSVRDRITAECGHGRKIEENASVIKTYHEVPAAAFEPSSDLAGGDPALTQRGQIFLLSPARAGGPRYSMLVRDQADFHLARKVARGSRQHRRSLQLYQWLVFPRQTCVCRKV